MFLKVGAAKGPDIARAGATAICAAIGALKPAAAPHAQLIRFVADRPGHDHRYAIDAGKIGELLIAKPRVIRVTHTLIFTNTEVVAEGRCVATASGVFKILKDNS